MIDDTEVNLTWLQKESIKEGEYAGLFICLDILTMIAIITGNGIVLYLIVRYKRLRTTTNIYIISLCAADISLAVITVPIEILSHFSAGDLTTSLCKAIEFIDYMAQSSNIFCVVAIACDRHRAVVHPLEKKLTFRQCVRNVSFVWFCAGLYGIRAAIVYDVTEEQHFVQSTWQSFYQCAVPENNMTVNRYLFLLDFLVMYSIPLCVILVLYAKIWMAMHRSASKVQAPHMAQKRRKKVMKMLLMVVLVFAICQLPVHIWELLVYWGSGPFSYYLIVKDFFDLVSISNGWLNVVAYIWFNDSFSGLLIPCKRFRRVVPRQIVTIDGSIAT